MLKSICYLLVIVFFVGCANNQKVIYKEYKKPTIEQTQVSLKEEIKLLNGVIKGSVEKVAFDGSNWDYRLKGNDTSNGKLSKASFTCKEKFASLGDEVYVIIKNGKLSEYFMLNKANIKKANIPKSKPFIKKKIIKKKTKSIFKRTKKQQVLSVPSTESISLD